MAIEVNAKDVNDAENFLEEFLTDSVADGDYTDGTALRDLTVKAIAFNFAYLRKVAAQVRVRQSLKTISEVDTSDDPEAADDAVDEILSNWFAGRQTGTYTHITAYAHVSQPVDITVAAETLFYKTADRVFVLDNNGEDLFVSAEELTALFSATGETSDYVFPIPLIAELPGTDYNIAPGAFSSFDAFSPYVTRVETLETASGGEGVETSTDYLERASSLVTVRNLINARSNDAVLREEFSDVKRTLTVGMGDPEMARDLIKEDATGIEMHVGAHMDTFLFMNTVETSFSGVVGAPYARPDGLIVVFRDATYTGVTLFTANVTPGMVLRIKAYLPIEPHDYMIREVYDTTLVVSTRVPFPVATDEQSPVGYVTWSIGHLAPGFEDIIPNQVTGETSRQMQNSGRITLPGGPVYLIKDVTIDDPADLDADSEDGLVHLNVRANTTPTVQTAPDNEYQLLVHTPLSHQSGKSYAEVVVGPDTDVARYDGKTCKVIYDTLVGFSSVHNYVNDRRRRIAAESPLVRGFHPAYLSFTMEYKLSTYATTAVDDDEVLDYVVAYINAFNPLEVLSVNQLMDAVRVAFPDIGRIYPFTIYYDVHAPDGRVIQFSSTEEVTVPWDSAKLAAVLSNPDDAVEGLTNPGDYGLSDDVIRYLCVRDALVIQARG